MGIVHHFYPFHDFENLEFADNRIFIDLYSIVDFCSMDEPHTHCSILLINGVSVTVSETVSEIKDILKNHGFIF